MKKTSVLILCGFVLTACGGTHPTQLIERVDFLTPTKTLVGKIDAVEFLAGSSNGVANEKVTIATFYVGDRSYAGKRLNDNMTWGYTTTNPCQDLPQGSNIKARYELTDASKNILDSKEQLLTRINTCR